MGAAEAPAAPVPTLAAAPTLAPIAAHAPTAGTLEALFAAPPGAVNLRQVRDPDVLWEIIDAT